MTWIRVANMIQKYFMSSNKSSTTINQAKRGVNDHDFEHLKSAVMNGREYSITKENLEALFSKALTPVMQSYKRDPSITKYWDNGINFGFVPKENALALAREMNGSVLFFCCEMFGNFGIATPEGDCFFIESEKLTKCKTIAQLVIGERRITRVLTFTRKPFSEYNANPVNWWDNLNIAVNDKKDLFQGDVQKNMNVPEGYIVLG